jgi:hypothetical protein
MNTTLSKHHAEVKLSRLERRWNRTHTSSKSTWLAFVTKRFHKATRQAAKKLCVAEIADGNTSPVTKKWRTYHA